MGQALGLAKDRLGQTWPNPAVGCLLVKDGEVVAFAATAMGGRPHAEQIALEKAGSAAKEATAYVTLEPCAHEGKTPSCARLLAEAGVARVIYAVEDPDPRVSGGGNAIMEKAGITVQKGLMQEEAARLNEGFFTRLAKGRPMVSLKIATDREGFIAPGTGEKPVWVTGEEARAFGHQLRASHDAILVGSGTVLADDPLLTTRIEGVEGRNPVRIVLDRRGRVRADCKLVQTAGDVPLWLMGENARPDLPATVKVFYPVMDMDAVLSTLAKQGITRLLVEGGPSILKAFMEKGAVDYLYWFRGAGLISKDGIPVMEKGAPDGFICKKRQRLGKDTLEIYAMKD